MAKAIKRVGVIFFAVAIICLMAIGVILGVSNAESVTNSNDNSLNFDANSNNMQNVADNSFTLSGTTAQMAAKWNEACELSASTNSAVYVKLEQDWIANSDARHTFGTGVGFRNGAIFVSDCEIILDLNGHKIDRQLTKETAITDGTIFYLSAGELTIWDKTGAGAITNGANLSLRGGAIALWAQSTLNIYGGTISNSYVSNDGGGISAYESSTINMYGGTITNNSGIYAGGMMINDSSTLNMYGGSITNNSTSSYGGGLYIYNESHFNMYGGIISGNHCPSPGGGIRCFNNSTFTMYGGEITNNTGSNGGGLDIVHYCTAKLIAGKIYNNSADRGGGVTYGREDAFPNVGQIIIGENFHIYDNVNSKSGAIENFYLRKGELIYIDSKLSSTNVGVTLSDDYGSGAFTSGYKTSGNTLSPNRFFTSDKTGLVASASGNEVTLSSGTQPTQTASWNWSGAGTGSSSTGYQVVPYTGSAYTIKSSVGTFYDKTNTSHTSFSATNAGTYSFYVNGNYLNPTFTFVIEPKEVDLVWNSTTTFVYDGQNHKPTATATGIGGVKMNAVVDGSQTNIGNYYAYAISLDNSNYKIKPTTAVYCKFSITPIPIDKPTVGDTRLVYNGTELTYTPNGFNANQMTITSNIQTEIGDYTAKVKPILNHMWQDGTSTQLDFPFKIIAPGVVAKESSNYDYIYKQTLNNDSYRKAYGNDYKHKINDSTLNIVNGKPRYILGNIKYGTNISSFLNNLQSESKYLKIYQSESDTTPVFNGIANNGVVANEVGNLNVATGFKIELYRDTTDSEPLDIIYLSVLGDVVANGVIDTADVTFISRIAKGEIKLETLSIEEQLAAMVDNKGKVTSTDGKILLNAIGKYTKIDSYFDSIASDKNVYEIWSIGIDSMHGKIYRTSRELTTSKLYNNAIIGNIAPQTKANVFKTKLATQLEANSSTIAIYKANGAVASDNDYIGTGCYIIYNSKTIYLSVLGDLTGDGIVNTMDVT
ncbi:MAG TPA: hypothetical protein PLZ09_03325, partial [Clostridia bacterium]|nr:hypothetical protein [Clostridia bacterium]